MQADSGWLELDGHLEWPAEGVVQHSSSERLLEVEV